ncbi:MAG TPA: HAMP domain-containing sensor histidine kinase [Candidatus Eisenbacteria bacterium]
MSSAPLPAPETPSDSAGTAAGSSETPPAAPRLVDRQGYSLLSLVELSRKLWNTHDVHDAAESLLLNLMGQIGSGRAALWLDSEDSRPVLIRCHGIGPPLADALAAACWTELRDHFRAGGPSVTPEALQSGIGRSTQSLAKQAKVALFAPVTAPDMPLGVVALGAPVGGAFASLQLDVIEASLAVAGLALRSAHLHSAAIESARTLRRTNEEIRELDRLKSEFMDHVNHELRTPLSVLTGCLQCLLEPGIQQEDRGLFLRTATESTQRLQRLVERLLAFSDTTGDAPGVQMAETDLTAFITEYFEERRPGVSAGLRELALESDGGRRPVRLDPMRMRQVVDELIDNAIKFSSRGTKVQLWVRDRVEQGAAWAEVGVADQGIGIPKERLPELFQSFRQLDGGNTRKAGGLGIGLTMAKRLMEAMGGRITVESEGNAGAVFSLLLPRV